MNTLNLKEVEKAFENAQISPEEVVAVLQKRKEPVALRLMKHAQKKLQLMQEYAERSTISQSIKENGYSFVAGLDEVGRGPLAGPLTVACVLLDEKRPIYGLRDSKRLSEKRREELAEEIREQAISFSLVSFTEEQIDQLNILEATRSAMILAVEMMETAPDYLLIDALHIDSPLPQLALVGGDDKSNEIAAASILAKVERDRYMKQMHKRYPVYRFDKNKGYGTAEHMRALRAYGPCPIHRRTFIRRIIQE